MSVLLTIESVIRARHRQPGVRAADALSRSVDARGSPTDLLAAQPELGRGRDTGARRIIGALSRRGILLGTAVTAGLPALVAATDPRIRDGALVGPGGPGHLGGAPAEQPLYPRLRSADEARRVWDVSERLTGVRLASTDGNRAQDATAVVVASPADSRR